ncbi:MAG TPA: serine--tRNA ligase, partial [Candidatus Xenobia bacterium]
MFDARLLRSQPDAVKAALGRRGVSGEVIDKFLALDEKRRELIKAGDELKHERNVASEQIAKVKKAGGDIAAEQARMREVGDRIKAIEKDFEQIDIDTKAILETMPNMPHESVPDGASADDNLEVRHWGQPRTYSFKPKPHWEVAEGLGIIDFERASKLSGSRFILSRGLGATLERALINFMIDLHVTQHGYEETLPPYLVNRDTMYGTGQLPKFEEDLFKTSGATPFYLIPTAEVPLT